MTTHSRRARPFVSRIARALGTTLAVTTLATSAIAAPPTGSVRSIRRDLVYVDLGRVHGVAAGDLLGVEGSPVQLEVVHLGEKQLAAKKLGTGEVQVGAHVTSPHEPGQASSQRPVVHLTTPRRDQVELPWSGDPTRRATLVATPESPTTATKRRSVRGDLRVSYVGLLDSGENNLDLHQTEVRSKLAVDLGDGLAYVHDVSGRIELGPALDERHGSDSRPFYRIRQLALSWHSPGWGAPNDDHAGGSVDAALGRIQLWQSPSSGLVDGLRADLGLGAGFTAGLYGGLVPALFDTAPSTAEAIVGGHASWVRQETGDTWRARASLSTATSFWHGALNRLDLGINGSLARARDFDVYALVVATLVDASLMPDAQSAFSLSRAFVGTRVRPLEWLTIDAHYAHDQFVIDRETLALLGASRLLTDPRESGWLQVRFDPLPDVSVSVSGTLGYGSTSAYYRGAGARLGLRNVFVRDLRVGLAYQLGLGPDSETHNPSIDLSLPLGRTVELGLGYGFATFRSRLLDERQDEHRLDAGLDLLLTGPWRLHVRGSYAFGSQPSQVGILSQIIWRF